MSDDELQRFKEQLIATMLAKGYMVAASSGKFLLGPEPPIGEDGYLRGFWQHLNKRIMLDEFMRLVEE